MRNRTAGYIQLASGHGILIDAGPDLRHQCLAHGVRRVDAVVYTHAHADHILGTDDLRVFNFTGKKRIPCYGTPTTLRQLQVIFPYIFDPDPSYAGGLVARLDTVSISTETSFDIEGLRFEPFPLPHGNVTVTGFRVGNLGYATDCKGISDRGLQVLAGVQHLFIDGLRWETHNTHNSIGEAIELARAVGAAKTYIIHTTHSIDYDETSATLPEGVELGYDGLRVEFSD